MSQKVVNIHEAKTHFSRLLAWVCNGEEIVIAKAGKPVALLVPIEKKIKERFPGSAEGKILIPNDFEAPLPDYLLNEFEK